MNSERIRNHPSWTNRFFHTELLGKSRMAWVDYLRGIAIILVVYHHVRVGIERSGITVPDVLVKFNMVFYSFRMPLFFILSGLFISRSMARNSVKQIINKKFELLLYPYLVWAFLQVSLQIIFGAFTNSQRSLLDYSYILYHPRFLDQFWYLPALFFASVNFLFINRFLKPTHLWHLVIALFFYLLSPFFQNASILSDWMQFYIFFAIGYVCTEYFFRPKTQKFFYNKKALLGIIPVFAAVQLFYLSNHIGDKTLQTEFQLSDYSMLLINQIQFLLIAMVGALSMFFIVFRLALWNKLRFLRILGYHSLYIYVMHVMVIGFVRLALVNVLNVTNPVALLVVSITAGVVLPIIAYNLLIKNGPLWMLFTWKKPAPAAKPAVYPPSPVIASTNAATTVAPDLTRN